MLHTIDWQSFYAARAENELGNKNSSVYTEAWSPDKSDATRFQTLVSDIDNVVFGVDHDKNIHALHSFKVSGGSLLRPSTKLMCLSGTGLRATAFIIDRQTLLNPCNMITPTIDELQECSNEDEVKAVNAPAEGGIVTYPGSASFLPAPISSGTSNYAKLITEVNAAAFEFDAEHEEDENYVTSATVHAADFILWAWGAGNGLATATKMTFDPNDEDLEQFRIAKTPAMHLPTLGRGFARSPPSSSSSSRSQRFPCPTSRNCHSPGRRTRSSQQYSPHPSGTHGREKLEEQSQTPSQIYHQNVSVRICHG
jgi:hypothetical protein